MVKKWGSESKLCSQEGILLIIIIIMWELEEIVPEIATRRMHWCSNLLR